MPIGVLYTVRYAHRASLSAPLASAHLIHYLLKDILDLLVQCFCLTAHLRVIWSGNPVINSNFCESFLECPINEV
jgi:hypothetical protein